MKYIFASIVAGVLWMGFMVGISGYAFTDPTPSSIIGTWELKVDDKVSVTIIIDEKNMTVMGESIPYEAREEGKVVLVFTKPKKEAKPAGPIPADEVVFLFEPKDKDKIQILGIGVKAKEDAFLTRK